MIAFEKSLLIKTVTFFKTQVFPSVTDDYKINLFLKKVMCIFISNFFKYKTKCSIHFRMWRYPATPWKATWLSYRFARGFSNSSIWTHQRCILIIIYLPKTVLKKFPGFNLSLPLSISFFCKNWFQKFKWTYQWFINKKRINCVLTKLI